MMTDERREYIRNQLEGRTITPGGEAFADYIAELLHDGDELRAQTDRLIAAGNVLYGRCNTCTARENSPEWNAWRDHTGAWLDAVGGGP